MGVTIMKTFIVLLLSAALVLGAPSDDGVPHQPRSASDEDYSSEDDASYSYEDYSSEEDYPEDDYSMDDYESDRSDSVESEESSESAESAEARSDPIDVATLINANGRSMRKDRAAKNFAPLECGTVDTLNYGEYAVIETPRFGERRYPNNYDCTWTLYIEDQAYYGYAAEGFGFNATSPNASVSLNLRFKTNRRGRGWGFRCFVESEAQGFTTAATTPSIVGPTSEATTPSTGSCECGIPNKSNRIVGGVETEVNEYPWQVALVSSRGSHPFCGGTLISDRHVMTAAHCTAGSTASSIAVLVGEHRIDDGQFTRIGLSAINDHPNYNDRSLNNDYSILTLAEPVTFSDKVRPACLPSNAAEEYIGRTATVSGWGTLTSGGNQPAVLNEVDVTVQSNDQCKQAYGSGITNHMICAADAGKDSCQGDSGGPLVTKENDRYTLIGVVSWGYGCADSRYPGVYARVTTRMDWI